MSERSELTPCIIYVVRQLTYILYSADVSHGYAIIMCISIKIMITIKFTFLSGSIVFTNKYGYNPASCTMYSRPTETPM